MMLDVKEKVEHDVFALKLATFGSDPERYAEVVFPEYYEGTTDLDSLGEYESVIYDFDNDNEMMTPQKMERLLGQFEPRK
jgi:hypothetical protein